MSLALLKHKGAVQPPRYVWDSDNIASNLALWSEEFDGTGWSTSGASISPNQTTAPDGALTADALVGDGLGANHYVQRAVSGLTVGDVYTEYFHVKPGAQDWCLVQVQYGSIGSMYFNVNTGALGTPVGTGLLDYGIELSDNGFYIVWVSFAATATTTALRVFSANADGGASYVSTTGAEIYVWGAGVDTFHRFRAYRKTTDTIITERRDRTRSSTAWTPDTGTPTNNNVIYLNKGAVQLTKTLATERRVRLYRARIARLLRNLTRNLINP